MSENTLLKQSAFAQAVYQGLTAKPKKLPSRFIYDARGDALFQQIMKLPQYYLTECERQILKEHADGICAYFSEGKQPFNLVELGAGDGTKTEILLRNLSSRQASFKYMPVDISASALSGLQNRLRGILPGLQIQPWEGTYFEMLQRIDEFSDARKVILFLGSNLGNMMHPQARNFLQGLSEAMTFGDYLFIGFDQKKHPQKILDAYNDPGGVTAAFNKNILVRINREFNGNFDPDKFLHWETYDPETGSAKSFLVATEPMRVHVGALELEVFFETWDTLQTELSQKYDDEVVQWLASGAGLEVVASFADPAAYYKNYLFRRKPAG